MQYVEHDLAKLNLVAPAGRDEGLTHAGREPDITLIMMTITLRKHCCHLWQCCMCWHLHVLQSSTVFWIKLMYLKYFHITCSGQMFFLTFRLKYIELVVDQQCWKQMTGMIVSLLCPQHLFSRWTMTLTQMLHTKVYAKVYLYVYSSWNW